jgi:hypothetical protein
MRRRISLLDGTRLVFENCSDFGNENLDVFQRLLCIATGHGLVDAII